MADATADNVGDDDPDARLRVHREAIDVLDREILARLNERAMHAKAIGTLKAGGGGTAYRPEREAQVLARLCEYNGGPLSDAAVIGVFRADDVGMPRARADAARRLPRPRRARSASGGGHGISAVRRRAAVRDHRRGLPRRRVGQADYGVVPVENSTEGAVGRTLDLMYTTELTICGEVKLRVQQNLLSNAPAIDRDRQVYSHAQSLAQCAQWLASHLPGAARIPVRATPRRRGSRRRRKVRRPSPARSRQRSTASRARARTSRTTRTTRRASGCSGRQAVPPSGRDETSLVMSAAEQARRRARAAGAVREARRVDDALRVAAGAHRTVGVPVLRRPRRPSRRSDGRAQRWPNLPARLRSSSCWAPIPRSSFARTLSGNAGACAGSVGSEWRGSSARRNSCTNPRRPSNGRPNTFAPSRPTWPASRSRSSRASWASTATIVKLASNENPRGRARSRSPRSRAAAADLTRYPDGNGFELKDALAGRSACRRNRSCSATAATTCSSSSTQAFLRAGDQPCTRSTRSPCIRSPRRRAARGHRGAGEGPRPRPRRDAGGDHAADAHGVHRQPEQPDGHLARG